MTASQPGTAQATAVSAAATTNPYAGAYANYPTAYQQGTQPAEYQQGTQVGAYQQGTQVGAYQQGTQPATYQHGTQPAAYHQGTQAGAYNYAYDAATAYQMHAAQANAYAGYSGYPVAAYAQSALPNYPAAYAVPPQPISSGAATDVTNAYAAVGSTGYPAGQVQPNSGTANAAQAPPPPPTAPYPGTYDTTRVQR